MDIVTYIIYKVHSHALLAADEFSGVMLAVTCMHDEDSCAFYCADSNSCNTTSLSIVNWYRLT